MKYLYQFGIILSVTFAGELLHDCIPLPVPASIYGLLLMLLCLRSGLLRYEKIKEVSSFLLHAMPVMFVPAGVGLLAVEEELSAMLLPIAAAIVLTTILVMAVTGKMTEYFIGLQNTKEKH